MIIFVITKDRIDDQDTLKNMFLDQSEYPVKVVVNKCEAKLWESLGWDMVVVPDSYRISDIRQHIARKFCGEDPHHLQLDDDLAITRRKISDEPGSKKANFVDITCLLDRMSAQMEEGYAHGGVSMFEYNYTKWKSFGHNERLSRFQYYNAEVVVGEGVQVNVVRFHDDFQLSLSLIELGYLQMVDYEFSQCHRTSNAPGGSTQFSSLSAMSEDAKRFQAIHPEFVKTVQKTSKHSWGGGTRTGVRISWKKAFGTKKDKRRMKGTHEYK